MNYYFLYSNAGKKFVRVSRRQFDFIMSSYSDLKIVKDLGGIPYYCTYVGEGEYLVRGFIVECLKDE